MLNSLFVFAVAYAYSSFCDLFTYPEWQGFEYTADLSFYGNDGFGAPTGRGVGIGWVVEFYNRLLHHYVSNNGTSQLNSTLDTQASTFPLNQTIMADFSHDTNIQSISTALGLKQLAQVLPGTGPPKDQFYVVSLFEPFATRWDWETIRTPHPLKDISPNVTNATMSDYYDVSGGPTTYMHLVINQRTLALGASYPECGHLKSGWCEMETFLNILSTKEAEAEYDFACNGDYPAAPPGSVITNGVPVATP